MPFSWKKKTRCNRFSKLVTDHLQSPKHGGSLVVETGFPTSLIDLYVRNRGRFRKSAVMKPTENDSPSPSPSSSPASGLLIDSINLSSSSSLVSLLDSNNSSSGGYDYKESNEIIEEDVVVSGKMEVENYSEIEVERSVESTKLNPVFVVMLKVLLMLVLVLGTKRFTLGITVSAFLLCLLESVRKPLLRKSSLITPDVDSKTPIESSFHEKNASLVVCSEVMEIEELVESKLEVKSEKELDEVKSEDLIEVRYKSSRRAIIKSRMKKLVPKNLRRSSIGSKGEISCEFKEEETVKCVQNVKPLVFSSKCSDSKGENFSVLKQEYDEIVEIEKRSSSLTYSSDIYCNDKELGMESQQNSGSLVLCLIVLVGLIGGRALALSLVLLWCVMLKTLQWRNVKFFIS